MLNFGGSFLLRKSLVLGVPSHVPIILPSAFWSEDTVSQIVLPSVRPEDVGEARNVLRGLCPARVSVAARRNDVRP